MAAPPRPLGLAWRTCDQPPGCCAQSSPRRTGLAASSSSRGLSRPGSPGNFRLALASWGRPKERFTPRSRWLDTQGAADFTAVRTNTCGKRQPLLTAKSAQGGTRVTSQLAAPKAHPPAACALPTSWARPEVASSHSVPQSRKARWQRSTRSGWSVFILFVALIYLQRPLSFHLLPSFFSVKIAHMLVSFICGRVLAEGNVRPELLGRHFVRKLPAGWAGRVAGSPDKAAGRRSGEGGRARGGGGRCSPTCISASSRPCPIRLDRLVVGRAGERLFGASRVVR